MTADKRILVIDDEKQILRLFQISLESAGFATIPVLNGKDGLTHAAMDHPDLVILDLGLPDMDGIEVLRSIREWSKMPVVVVSARNTEQDIVAALDAGADDYLTKPFRTGELLARVRTALRRSTHTDTQPIVRYKAVEIDLPGRTVKRDGQIVKLTATEFSMLALFVTNAGRVLTHDYILEHVWGHAYAGETQYTRVYVAQLRKKLEADPARPELIVTESGIGYRFMAGE